jgi:hypothetical protein
MTAKMLAVALAMVTGCGASKKSAGFHGGSAYPAAPMVSSTSASGEGGATIARDASQLTAGVWDDNLNFEWFSAYAARTAQTQDLRAFDSAAQQAAHIRHSQLRPHRELDIQLVIDTTGSMGDELGYLQRELVAIVDTLSKRFPNVTPRWSLVVYKDRDDAYVTRSFDFTTDTARFARALAAQSAGGGGDFPEAVIPARAMLSRMCRVTA